MGLFNQENRDFNAALLDDSKPYIRGPLTRKMNKRVKEIKKAIENLDVAALKSAPTLGLEIELDIIIAGLKAVYQDFKTKIDNVSSRLDKAVTKLDFLSVRRINAELQRLGGLMARNNEEVAKDAFDEITTLITTKFGDDFDPEKLGLTVKIPNVKKGIKELMDSFVKLVAKADQLEKDFKQAQRKLARKAMR